VGLIAPPWVPVPPTVYGGTELVVDGLARGLERLGCKVVLFATGDSTCPVTRRWRFPRALGTAGDSCAEAAHLAHAYGSLRDLGVDVIHDHTVAGPPPRWRHGPTPVVMTVHGEFTRELRDHYVALAADGVQLVAISDSQRRSAPEVDIATVIHHGIDVAQYPAGAGQGGYVAFLGRMSPDKGADRAIAAARAAGWPIRLAAKVREPEEHRYFDERIKPLLGPDAVYVGEIGGRAKLDLLANAHALLNPIRWPEPFGLAMIEALACGTPVLTFGEGAAPEIVQDGVSGFLCRDVEDMAAAIDRVPEIDRAACRARVRERFSQDRMLRRHVDLYRQVVAVSSVRSDQGVTTDLATVG
jgi:glycosyltransferase involved in cell wall biosynthesis